MGKKEQARDAEHEGFFFVVARTEPEEDTAIISMQEHKHPLYCHDSRT
jgi:hypothetical protein